MNFHLVERIRELLGEIEMKNGRLTRFDVPESGYPDGRWFSLECLFMIEFTEPWKSDYNGSKIYLSGDGVEKLPRFSAAKTHLTEIIGLQLGSSW